MGLFGFGKMNSAPPAAAVSPAAGLAEGQLADMRELARHLEEDRALLFSALRILHPGKTPKELAEDLHGVCFRPLGLAAFFLALVDWEGDALHFPLYHEGGRARPRPPRRLSAAPGLTGKALSQTEPLYLRTLEEGRSYGVVLSEVEKESGLVPESWYGVPLGADPAWGGRPFGVVSFQSFQPDAFTESRRNLMDGLAGILAFALKADPSRPVPGKAS